MSRMTVNGQPVEYRMNPDTPLLWALREASNLTGTKYGCGTGDCGACLVHVDGSPVLSCRVSIAACEGTMVTTIEGLSRDRSHPVQQAFIADMVPQCGFCIPGMVMAAAALVDRSDSPSDDEIDAAITNLCRCGIYPRLREAIRKAAGAHSGRTQIPAAPVPGTDPAEAARTVPALQTRRPPGTP